MIHLGDITKIKGNEVPVTDAVCFGAPCQDLSRAGKRKGMKHSDAGDDETTRSGLYYDAIRIIKEMRENDRMHGRTGVDIRPRYGIYENVPGAFSSNQGLDFQIVLNEIIRVAEPEAPSVPVPEKGWPTAGCIVGECWSVAWRVLDAQFWGTSDKPLPQRRRRIALVADFGGLSAPEILFVRKSVSGNLEPGEPKRKEAPRDAGEGSGGAIGCDLYNGSLSGDKAVSLNTNANATGAGPTVAQPVYGFDPQACRDVGQYVVENMANTLTNGTNPGWHNGVCYSIDQGGGKSSVGTYVAIRHIVRRLTPLECERLQGFPDGWTDIGEWIDSKGKKHKEADSPRLAALGNSIALPPWKWVLKRLCACYERDATMASLFDGIGGFPYIWEQLNGKGSCLWASEIEEFPIAVTKARFGE